jgi:hypothetical protein
MVALLKAGYSTQAVAVRGVGGGGGGAAWCGSSPALAVEAERDKAPPSNVELAKRPPPSIELMGGGTLRL